MTTHTTKYLKDYTPYPFTVATLDLRVELDPGRTLVKSRLDMHRNPAAVDDQAPLELNGEHLAVTAVRLDGQAMPPGGEPERVAR